MRAILHDGPLAGHNPNIPEPETLIRLMIPLVSLVDDHSTTGPAPKIVEYALAYGLGAIDYQHNEAHYFFVR